MDTILGSFANQPNPDINFERAKRNLEGLKAYLIENHISGEKMLEQCDKNLNQGIDVHEFFEVMNQISYGITEEEIKWMFSCIDKNNSGNITIEELFHFIHY